MSWDPHTPKPGPRTAPDGPESASTPAVGISGGSGGLNGPQAGSEGFESEQEAVKPYRVLVTGSRDWGDLETLWAALDEALALSQADGRKLVVVQGGATGADMLAKNWAVRNLGAGVMPETHPARWREHGIYNPQAGLARNRRMVDLGADVALAFIRNGSRGASHCAALAEEAGIPVRRWTA